MTNPLTNTLVALSLALTGATAMADIQTNTPFSDVLINNTKPSGGQGLRVNTAPGNQHGIAIMGHAGSSTSIGGYFDAIDGGTALSVLGKSKFNLYGDLSLNLNHTTQHIRMTNGAPGVPTGYGVVMGNDGNTFYIGVTNLNDAEGKVVRKLVQIDLTTGQIIGAQ
jgi:hypothetical protein